MTVEPVFGQINRNADFRSLQAGFYWIDSHPGLTSDGVKAAMRSSGSISCIDCLYSGLLLPYYLHNANNLLVGVMGNIDLAAMFMPDVDRVSAKLDAARHSTQGMVEYIRELSFLSSDAPGTMLSHADLDRCIRLVKAACGRSVTTTGMDVMTLESPIPCGNLYAVLAALNGMAVWTILCLGGNGVLEGSLEDDRISFNWHRPGESGVAHMPGAEHAASVIALAGGSAVSGGCTLVAEEWTDNSGKVSLFVK